MAGSDECCGFAGSYSIKQPGISSSILGRKIENIRTTSAEMVVTDCPGCIMQIKAGLRDSGAAIDVIHTAQLLAELLD
jgi:Fe-S oxidoreductase